MERDTTVITAGDHRAVVKSYATARETNAVQQAYFKGTKVELVGDAPRVSEFNPAVQFDVQQEMIRQLVVSLDESSDRLVDRFLDLPNDTFADFISQLDAIASKKKS